MEITYYRYEQNDEFSLPLFAFGILVISGLIENITYLSNLWQKL